METITGKIVVITGASSGFGKGVARALASRGDSVVLAARRDALLDELARECETAGGRGLPVRADVSNPADIEKLAAKAVAEVGRIDVWINNAGTATLGRFEEIPLSEHVQVIETNLLGVIYGSYYAMRQFRQQGSGNLINIASVVGEVPSPYYASYAASKAGVINFDKVLREELAANSIETIHVSTVKPTSMDTPFFDHAANHTGREVKPIPPLYDPQEVVDAIVRLVDDPENEVTVGRAGKIAVMAHRVAPGLVEKRMTRETHKALIEESAPAEDSPGAVEEPRPTGTETRAGRLKQ